MITDDEIPILQIPIAKAADGRTHTLTILPGDRLGFMAGTILEMRSRWPLTPMEVCGLARHLEVKPSPGFEFLVQDAIVGFGILIAKGWHDPRWWLAFYDDLIRNPEATFAKHRGDPWVSLTIHQLLAVAEINPLDPNNVSRPKLEAIINAARADMGELILRGSQKVRVEQLFWEQVCLIARAFGCDLKLPTRDPDRGGSRRTPLYGFAAEMRDRLAQYGPAVLGPPSQDQGVRFARLASLPRRTILGSPERAKQVIRKQDQ